MPASSTWPCSTAATTVTTVGDGQISVVNYNGTTVTNVSAAFKPLYDACNAVNCTAEHQRRPAGLAADASASSTSATNSTTSRSIPSATSPTATATRCRAIAMPNRVCRTAAARSDHRSDPCFGTTAQTGMVPHIEVKQNEFSLTGGVRGEASGWNWDLSGTYAEDVANVYTTHSANASLFVATGQSPTDFYDGSFQFNQFVGTLDVKQGVRHRLRGAADLRLRRRIPRRNLHHHAPATRLSLYVEGGQSFPGYALSDAGTIDRNAKAVYVNFITDPVDDWTVDLAGRYEHYSDFGDTVIGKITTRYDFSRRLRAPRHGEHRLPRADAGGIGLFGHQRRPDQRHSPARAQFARCGQRRASVRSSRRNRSTSRPAWCCARSTGCVVTLDGYYIKIKDRIVSSGAITGQRSSNPFPSPRRC